MRTPNPLALTLLAASLCAANGAALADRPGDSEPAAQAASVSCNRGTTHGGTSADDRGTSLPGFENAVRRCTDRIGGDADPPRTLIASDPGRRFGAVACDGTYAHHLQGICVDSQSIYWSFTTTLVKTDLEGNVLKTVPVANHHGDLCLRDGTLYVAVNLGKFNDPAGNADSWVYAYDCETLRETARYETQEAFHGAGGIGSRDGRFFVVGGLPEGVEENYVYEYDEEFRFVKRHVVPSGHTHLGIQTATFAHDRWWFGCYGSPKILLVADADFELQGRFEFDGSLGLVGLPDGRLLAASGRCDAEHGCTGSARPAVPDEEAGLAFVD